MELRPFLLWILILSGTEGLAFNATQRAVTCRDGWTSYRNSCYLFVDSEQEDWTEAQKHCELFHGYLADIVDADESTFVKTELQHRHASGCFYIGATDLELEGHWLWVHTDDPVQYTDWGQGEPNAVTRENCVCLWDGVQFGWADVLCTLDYNFICKMSLTGTDPDVIG
ncbi:perlucin-like protein isoform X2 [Argopecten irradians]|uniref:perlucin-like protein isoform X1 n=1 Tax=Argopecten irradians TaxID=31199 RepID=UPI003718325F